MRLFQAECLVPQDVQPQAHNGLLGPPTKFTTLVRAPPGLPAARVMEQLAEAGGGLPAHLQEVRLHAYHSSGA